MRTKTLLLLLLLLLMTLAAASALSEAEITWTPETPRAGDVVDLVVRPARENPLSVTYRLDYGDQKVFAGKEDDHYAVSFRPRQQGTYTLTVTLSYGKKDQEVTRVDIPVSGEAPVQQGTDVVYSQKDGWWKKRSYGSSTLEIAGCGIFTLAHAIQRLGFSGEDVLPETLGKTYAFCLVQGGTANERLLTNAGQVYDFVTQDELEESEEGIAACLRRGDLFSFSIVKGHIALADGLSADGSMVHIVDSAPSATFERIKNASIYLLSDDGSFREIASPAELPDARYYFETRLYGGGEYWLPLSYCARRGMRLIRPSWLKLSLEEGLRSVELSQVGTMQSRVLLEEDGDPVTVPTRDLLWTCIGADSPQIAVVTAKSGSVFRNAAGDKIDGFKRIARGTLLLPLDIGEKTVYVWYKGAFGYVPRKEVNLLEVAQEDFPTGILSYNGHTSGTAMINLRLDAGSKTKIGELKIGTPVAVAEQREGYALVEGKGLRGWVQDEYLTMDQTEENSDGQEINQGE